VAGIREVRLGAVDWSDHPFAVPSTADIQALAASLAAVGLLNPPWLRAKAEGRWQAVSGLKRLKAAASLGWECIPARTLGGETPDSRCLLIALHDNAFGRGFELHEQVFYAHRLMAQGEEAQVAQRFLPLLGLPPSIKMLRRLLAAASLEDSWQKLMASGGLALTAASRLAGWPPADRRAALPFLENLPFSQSKQEEFLEGLELLARREGLALAEILSRPELGSCLDDAALTPQEKAARVRRRLRAWALPRLSAAETAFEQGLTRLGLKHHSRLRLTPPPAFEGPDFQVEIKFQDAAELEQLLAELSRKAREAEFYQLLRL
jgi:ParB family transcriptional regulator, chromosome partitioning protein